MTTIAPALERMHIVIAGHVDHGKSTIIGRLLADTGSLPDGKLEQVRANCERNSKPFEYAFLLDALKDEQSQGITIDAARIFFSSSHRQYLVLDAPGHIEFLKNMITGAARAEAALLVIDAQEGIRENSRRHGYMLGMLGIRQVAVLVNKMDLVRHDRRVFDGIVTEFTEFLAQVGLTASAFIPVSGRDGENLATPSPCMPWYDGPTVLEALDRFTVAAQPVNLPFRMPVQDVYKFTGQGDDRRIVAGTVDAGTLAAGDEVVFYPSGKKSRVRSLEAFNAPAPGQVRAGEAAGLTLTEQVYVTRGEIATRAGESRPHVTTRLRVSLFWLGRTPLARHRDYTLKLGSARVTAHVEAIHRVINAADLREDQQRDRVERHEVAECTLVLARAIAMDLAADLPSTGRFVLVEDYEIRGGGIVREALPDRQGSVREKVLLRNYKWESSTIPPERRASSYGQRAAMLLVTGPADVDRKALAKHLESRLFADGRVVYFLGIGNVLYGVDADIERTPSTREEHLRRLGEVANLMLDAGLLLIVTASELTRADLDLIRTMVDPECLASIWVGDELTTDLPFDLRVPDDPAPDEATDRIVALLAEKGFVFKPW